MTDFHRLRTCLLLLATGALPAAGSGQSPSILFLLPTDGRLVTLESEQSGALSASDHVSLSDTHLEAWALQGEAGASVTLDLVSERFDPVLYVVGPGLGETLMDDDGGDGCNARLTVTFLESGTFTVVASSTGPRERGTYTLRASTSPPAAPTHGCGETDPAELTTLPTEGRALALGEERTGTLNPFSEVLEEGRRAEAWTLTGSPGERVSVILESANFDSFLYVVDPDGRTVLADDDGGGGLHSRLIFGLTSTRPYTVVASTLTPDAEGPYTIRIEEPLDMAELPAEGRVIALGESVEGLLDETGPVLEDGRRGQAWALDVAAGTTVTVELVSDVFDAFLYVAGPGLPEPLTDDDGGGELNSRITFTAPESGSYRIVVSALGGDATGPFTLWVSPG